MKNGPSLIKVVCLLLCLLTITSCSTNPQSVAEVGESTTSVESDDWLMANDYIYTLYGLPPVSDTDELREAAYSLFEIWFYVSDVFITQLEEEEIPWDRTPPFCYLFNYYVLHSAQLRKVNTPIELIAADTIMADIVKDMQDEAEELMRSKFLGEQINSFSTSEEAMSSFKEIDPKWEVMMQEAIDKA